MRGITCHCCSKAFASTAPTKQDHVAVPGPGRSLGPVGVPPAASCALSPQPSPRGTLCSLCRSPLSGTSSRTLQCCGAPSPHPPSPTPRPGFAAPRAPIPRAAAWRSPPGHKQRPGGTCFSLSGSLFSVLRRPESGNPSLCPIGSLGPVRWPSSRFCPRHSTVIRSVCVCGCGSPTLLGAPQ